MKLKTQVPLVIFLLFVLGSVAYASSEGMLWYSFLVPVVSKTQGAYGTYWRTDLHIVNPYPWKSITVTLTFFPQGQDNSYGAPQRSYTIGPSDELILRDVVGSAFGRSGNGALVAWTSDYSFFALSARTYTGNSATYGQTEMGHPKILAGNVSAYFSGLRCDSRFRSNVGVVNLSGSSIALTLTAYDSGGVVRGSSALQLPPYSQKQVSACSFSSGFGTGYLKVTCSNCTPDTGWLPYLSVVDNSSGDAVFIEEQADFWHTSARPYYQLAGWWHATLYGPSYEEAYFEIKQFDGYVELWRYLGWNASLDSVLWGYVDGNRLHLEGLEVYSYFCQNVRLVSSSLNVTSATSFSGTITLSGGDPLYCMDGTYTLDAYKMSGSPYTQMGKRRDGNIEPVLRWVQPLRSLLLPIHKISGTQGD